MLHKPFLLGRTLRYLSRQQLWSRLRAQMMQLYYRSTLYSRLSARRHTHILQPHSLLTAPPRLHLGQATQGENIAQGTFHFIGHTQTLGHPNTPQWKGWYPHQTSPLWLFNLHYHEWLNDLRAANQKEAAQQLISSWLIACNHYHPISWHPYPTSLRIVRWLTHGQWLLAGASTDFSSAFLGHLQRQIHHLTHNLEHDLGTNHLLKNLKALAFVQLAAPSLTPPHQPNWLQNFIQELAAQTHPDGGHCEASPHYQAQVLEDAIEVNLLCQKIARPQPKLTHLIHRLGQALAFYRAPNGNLTLMNDSAHGNNAHLDMLVKQANIEDYPKVLQHTGYATLQQGPMWVMFDAGPIGPNSNPGHAHADLLSLEIMLNQQWLIVNSGTGGYQIPQRLTLRQTAAHSTVVVRGHNSAEVWGSHRVGRRPTHTQLHHTSQTHAVQVQGTHNGYQHLGLHQQRTLTLSQKGTLLQGEDSLTATHARRPHQAYAQFILHPQVKVDTLSNTTAHLHLPNGQICQLSIVSGAPRLQLNPALYAPQFGPIFHTQAITIPFHIQAGASHTLRWQISLLP